MIIAAFFLKLVGLDQQEPTARRKVTRKMGPISAVGCVERLGVIRPRPALSRELRDADNLLRYLAATQGFTRPAIGLGVVLLAQSVNALGTASGYGAVSFLLWLLGLPGICRVASTELISRLDRLHPHDHSG